MDKYGKGKVPFAFANVAADWADVLNLEAKLAGRLTFNMVFSNFIYSDGD